MIRWTNLKLAKLRRLYPTMTSDELAAEFAPHSLSSIKSKAGHMKLRRRRNWKTICAKHKPIIFRGPVTT